MHPQTDDDSILVKLHDILKDHIDYKGQIDPRTTLDGLGLDSLDCLELIIDVEDCFDITIANGHTIRTFGELVKVVEEELSETVVQ